MRIVFGMRADAPDPSDLADGTVPFEPERAFDLPAGPRNGHAAALGVPCSEGPASMLLAPGETPVDTLMAREPPLEPMRLMEAGAGWTPRALAAAHELDRPIEANLDDPFVREVLHGRPGRR